MHKTDPDVMEAFAPFTVVNGKVWPVLEVQPATYRFRVLNGSNARTYRLVLFGDEAPELERITQIGTDHGLLRAPVSVPPDGLVLASAERADLLVDFSGLEPGSEFTLLNTAAAPFDGAPFPAANARGAADPSLILPYPHVMSFRVVPGPVTRREIPGELATDYRRPVAQQADAVPAALQLRAHFGGDAILHHHQAAGDRIAHSHVLALAVLPVDPVAFVFGAQPVFDDGNAGQGRQSLVDFRQ